MSHSGFSARMRRVKSAARWLALLAIGLSACAPARPPVCRACFWKYEPEALKKEVIAVYGERHFDDPLLEAQRRMLVATVANDRAAVCQARSAFARIRDAETAMDPARALFVAEALAFTAGICGADRPAAFRWASAQARGAGASFKARVYEAMAGPGFVPEIGEAAIARKLAIPAGATAFVLGASKIVVGPGSRVGAQVERTVRDWLSYQLAWDGIDRPVSPAALLTWHEGARLRDLLDATDAQVFPLTGALAVHHGGRWLAADGDGVFRFEVLDDKIQYPTTLVDGDVALLVDTHGISALVEPARREGVTLVVGCGDSEAKMQAAFALAQEGVNVWYPCDRFAGDVLGYDAPGVLIGSAPVRRLGDRAVIGDTPVRFDLREPFVVEDYEAIGPLRYYDAPARYFRALSVLVPVNVTYVTVDDAGQSSRVVDRAVALSSSAIGIRVQTPEDAAPVRRWLAALPQRRAVLFHSAPYPAGYALFAEFPKQTTFGDARPIFERGQVAH